MCVRVPFKKQNEINKFISFYCLHWIRFALHLRQRASRRSRSYSSLAHTLAVNRICDFSLAMVDAVSGRREPRLRNVPAGSSIGNATADVAQRYKNHAREQKKINKSFE